MNKNLLFLLLILVSAACGNEGKTDSETNAATAPPAVAPAEQLSPLTNEFFASHLSPVDYVDIVLYNHGFSMNISQPESIKSLFAGLTGTPATLDASCPAQGRIFFNSQGRTLTEADLHYIQNTCAALVFYVEGRKSYSAQLNQNGINIFNNYFSNAAQMQQDMQQQQGQQ